MYGHEHAVFGAQRNKRLKLYRMSRDVAHAKASRKRSDEKNAFHPREAFAYAATRAGSERKV
jgi:hypothetical protein